MTSCQISTASARNVESLCNLSSEVPPALFRISVGRSPGIVRMYDVQSLWLVIFSSQVRLTVLQRRCCLLNVGYIVTLHRPVAQRASIALQLSICMKYRLHVIWIRLLYSCGFYRTKSCAKMTICWQVSYDSIAVLLVMRYHGSIVIPPNTTFYCRFSVMSLRGKLCGLFGRTSVQYMRVVWSARAVGISNSIPPLWTYVSLSQGGL